MPDQALIILRDARSIIEQGFCKYAYARRANGLPCKPTDPRAVSHCMIGALLAAAGIETKDGHKGGKLSRATWDAYGDLAAAIGYESEQNIADWNNQWFRMRRGVLRAFDRAITAREKEQLVYIPLVAAKEPAAIAVKVD